MLLTAPLMRAAAERREARDFAARLAEAKARPRAGIHGFHRWYGKLVPAIPDAAIQAFTSAGDLVCDPFCGSGTVLVEARRAGRAGLGSDVSPFATLLSRVKTRPVAPAALEAAAARLLARLDGAPDRAWRRRLPALPNREHFYPSAVARMLVLALDAARAEEEPAVREWLLAVVSAINRDVSNADTRHVFPGVSKRMRGLIAAGWQGDVRARLERALSDRLRWTSEAQLDAAGAPEARVVLAPASELPVRPGSAALVVTNPPYVSSIRYVETFKLEAWWLGLVASREDLAALDAACLGSERVPRDEVVTPERAAELPASCRGTVGELALRSPRMAVVVARYLEGLAPVATRIAEGLAPGGHAVVKLAPSRVRGVTVPTPDALAELLEMRGVALVGAVEDAYTGSRSLTTARNWYSGRMDADALLVFRKETAAGGAP